LDRFEAMSMLLAVVDQGSFSAAGRALRVPVATLSRKVSELESRIGGKLLIRTTRRLALTDAGAAYVASTRRILEQLEEAEREAAGEFVAPKGELVLSAPIFFGRLHLLPVVADFLERFPEISVRLLLADHNLDLVGDRIDMAVRIGELPDSDMVATRIGSMRTVVCASPALVEKQGVPTSPKDLLQFPCVAMDAPQPRPGWRFGASGTLVPVKPRLSVSTAEAAMEAAINGVGVTRLLYYQVAEAVQDGRLVILLEAFEPSLAPVHLLHAARGQMPLKMRRFLDFAAPNLRQMLGAAQSRPHSPERFPGSDCSRQAGPGAPRD
jgi:DNA-binding transcriptional LysR family regulator